MVHLLPLQRPVLDSKIWLSFDENFSLHHYSDVFLLGRYCDASTL
jgi:hypothetical protein